MEPDVTSASKSLLDALLEGLIDAVVVIDPRGKIERASRSVEAHFGWTSEELVGENIRVLIPEPHRSQHDGYLERYRQTGRTWILGTVREFEVVRKDGSHVTCELSVSEIDAGPELGVMYCGSFRDVTERTRARQALHQSEAKFRAVFEHENQIVLLLDAAGRIAEANAPALDRIGARAEAVVGMSLPEAGFWSREPGQREAVARAYAQAIESGLGVTRADVCIARESAALVDRNVGLLELGCCGTGIPFPHAVSVRVLSSDDEGAPSAIVEIRDITELVESERRESAVIRSLARVGKESAVLAHELRSPVSSLELALKAVGRQLGEGENAVLEELAERMRRLEELLTRTLRFSKPLALNLKAISPADAFGHALSREAVAVRSGHVRTMVSVAPLTPMLLADEDALADLLANLVRNAVQAQPQGGALTLRARPLAEPGKSRVRLEIIDEGPGIPESKRESMFELFRSEKEDGTGLGLALARKIAEEHGATVGLESGEHGRGLSVVLDWPATVPLS